MHTSDGATGSASADLLTAYNTLNTTTSTFNHAPLLGNGDTLVAGVYAIAGNTALSGKLFLDAKNDPKAVFIFKISAAMSTTAASEIVLLNGAVSCNVFWKVEGLVSMATNTIMRGNVIANNAAIDMSSGVTIDGRIFSTTGAITLNGISAKIPVSCATTLLTGPAAPNLGVSGCFAIFSGNGAVTNAGISKIKGDVGTNVGLTVGYNPLDVTGAIHPIPDGVTAAAAADLLKAYDYLNKLPFDIELLYPAQFGNNLVLTPHTYLMNAATSFTGTVTLNGEGNANAIFVIQINGALTTSTYAKVLLANGTQAKNVFWKVDGAVNINDYSEFKGTIIANNGAISLATGVNLDGSALTTDGAFSTAAVIVTVSQVCSVLPVTWLYFRGKPVLETVLLEWGTSKEVNNGFFTLEKSLDAKTFETVTTVNAPGKSVNGDYQYSYTDQQPYRHGFYRISQTDIDGAKTYFNIIQVNANINQASTVKHYVQGNNIYVQISDAVPGKGLIKLYTIDGKKISSQKITLTSGASTFKIDKAFNNGIYVIIIENNGEKIYNERVIVR
jgi:hypothetical protein